MYKSYIQHNDMYGNYLVHFNHNHSRKNGQFTSGDGDGDGVVDDHHNYSKNKVSGETKSVSTGSKPKKTFKEIRKDMKAAHVKPLKIGLGIYGATRGAIRLAKGIEDKDVKNIVIGSLQLSLGAYKIVRGTGVIERYKDKKLSELQSVQTA